MMNRERASILCREFADVVEGMSPFELVVTWKLYCLRMGREMPVTRDTIEEAVNLWELSSSRN